MSLSHNRWGSSARNSGKDFWTACATEPNHFSVNDPERRAVSLLAELCDRPRVNFYLSTGYLPAMGNKTKTIYMVKHQGGVLELDDGISVATWCIGVGAHAWQGRIPATDNVIALKNLIEGEEGEFLKIGNRTAFGFRVEHIDGSLGCYGESFLGIYPQANGLKLQNKSILADQQKKSNCGFAEYLAPQPFMMPRGADPRNPFPYIRAVHARARRQVARMTPAEREAIRERQRHHGNIAAEFARHNRAQARQEAVI